MIELVLVQSPVKQSSSKAKLLFQFPFDAKCVWMHGKLCMCRWLTNYKLHFYSNGGRSLFFCSCWAYCIYRKFSFCTFFVSSLRLYGENTSSTFVTTPSRFSLGHGFLASTPPKPILWLYLAELAWHVTVGELANNNFKYEYIKNCWSVWCYKLLAELGLVFAVLPLFNPPTTTTTTTFLHPSACTLHCCHCPAAFDFFYFITSGYCNLPSHFLSHTGFTALPHPHRRDHLAHPRAYCDIIKPHSAAPTAPKLTCADLPPRSPGQKALSPQLRRLEQHQRQLLELQQRREQQSRPLEEAEQERKKREEEEQRKKKEEAEEEIKRNEEERKMREHVRLKQKEEQELKRRRDLELQLQQQQQELQQRQQLMQWQQELEQSNKGQTVSLSPSSGLCTIYEALENSEEEADAEDDEIKEHDTKGMDESKTEGFNQEITECETPSEDRPQDSPLYTESPRPHCDSPQTSSSLSQDELDSSLCPPESPEQQPPLDLDWGKKVDIVQQLINQTLLLNGDGCSSLLLLPGGTGGTLSPLESSLWPSLLPPLTPPSATVTSVSSFSPEATGSSPQGEWTVVELETHH